MELKNHMTDIEMKRYLVYWLKYYTEKMSEFDDLRAVEEIKLNNAKTTYAWCSNRNGAVCSFIFSRYNFFKGNDAYLKNTIVHELIHSIKGVPHGHGPIWKQKAAFYGDMFGMVIKRTSLNRGFDKVAKKPKRKNKFCITCDKCGKKFYRTRASNFTNHPDLYTHRLCGGHFSVEEI